MASSQGPDNSLGYGVLCHFDLPEQLLGLTVIEGELAVQHGEENHAQRPQVARLT